MPEDALREMASDEEYAIRRAVAGNPNTPVDALKKLAKDKDAPVYARRRQEIRACLKTRYGS